MTERYWSRRNCWGINEILVQQWQVCFELSSSLAKWQYKSKYRFKIKTILQLLLLKAEKSRGKRVTHGHELRDITHKIPKNSLTSVKSCNLRQVSQASEENHSSCTTAQAAHAPVTMESNRGWMLRGCRMVLRTHSLEHQSESHLHICKDTKDIIYFFKKTLRIMTCKISRVYNSSHLEALPHEGILLGWPSECISESNPEILW